MEIQSFLNQIRGQAGYEGQIEHIEHIAPRRAVYGQLDAPLDLRLQEILDTHGLSRFYSHQAKAINLIRRGKNVIVATFSASGKSLVYNTAVMQAILDEPGARALFLFPTKALAQDQLRKLKELFSPGRVPP
jgi:DEAD/DEAH box helicase domain-containing protein